MKLPLVAAGLSILVGCYDPDVDDCTVTCTSADQCAPGQACGADGFCASAEVAGHCLLKQDLVLEIHVDGDGKVVLDDAHVCDSRLVPTGTCTFTVAPQSAMELRAQAHRDHEFREWKDACAGETETCTLVPVTSLTRVGAKFE